MAHVTLCFASHRPETLPFASRVMRRHDAIYLEDPPVPVFRRMLAGDLSIENYVMETDTEYPEFSRQTCQLLRKLGSEGKRIFQVEPFLEVLLGIHESFADGGTWRDFDRGSIQWQVYEAERDATKALLNYYETVLKGSFHATVGAVKRFARADAARFVLRDSMRAQALVEPVMAFEASYVEAGYIHFALWRELRKRLPADIHLHLCYLMAPVVKALCGKRHLFAPGDILTLLYVFHPGMRGARGNLLAARSMIYNKLLEKEEIVGENSRFPHTRNEVETIRKVEMLSLEDCRVLFPAIRLAQTAETRSIVDAYIGSKTG